MAKNEIMALDPMEPVSVMIPHTFDDNVKGVPVNVNTQNFFVPFNEEVKVPRFIAEVIQRSISADRAAAQRRKKATEVKFLGDM